MTNPETTDGFDEYCRNLSWGIGTTEESKTLVIGNLRHFWRAFCLPRVTLMVAGGRIGQSSNQGHMCVGECQHYVDMKAERDRLLALLQRHHEATSIEEWGRECRVCINHRKRETGGR